MALLQTHPLTAQHSYGPNLVQPDLPAQEVEKLCKEFKIGLSVTPEKAKQIEEDTREQANDHTGLWRYLRRCRLTASNFGTVCKRRKSTPVANAVKSLLYKFPSENVSSLRWGRENEANARRSYEHEMESQLHPVETTRAGLVISERHGFLGCSPDDWVRDISEEEPGVAEYKCPYSARELTPLEACREVKGFFCTVQDGKPSLKKTHNYFYQIQGVMGITGSGWCDFVVWTPKGVSIERIKRDSSFWDKMLPKLEHFFDSALLPELASPQHPYGRPIREPQI